MGDIFRVAKTPEEFEIGDVIKHQPGTRYSGSPITALEYLGVTQVRVTFENGEIVEFFRGIKHEMQG